MTEHDWLIAEFTVFIGAFLAILVSAVIAYLSAQLTAVVFNLIVLGSLLGISGGYIYFKAESLNLRVKLREVE